VLIGFVFPAFGELYSSMGADLPSSTQMLIDVGTAMRANGVYMLMGVVVAVLAAVFYFRTPAGKLRRDALALRLPVIGRISHVKQLARAGRSIALLFKAGLPMTDIIRLTGEAAGNRVLRQSFADVEQDMLRGGGLSGPMAKNPLFLPLMVQMVKIGEETGNLDTNLEAVAENYEIEAEDKIRMMTAMIQPAMTIVIGGIVGLLALSLTTAMYSIYGQGI
jgi:type IV pilus assembly protein PilC